MKTLLKFMVCALALVIGFTSCDNKSEDSHHPYDAGHKPKNSQLNTSHSLVGKFYGDNGVVESMDDAQGIVFGVSKDGTTAYLCSFTDVMTYGRITGWYAEAAVWGSATPLAYDTIFTENYDENGEYVSTDTTLKGIPVVFDMDGEINTDRIIEIAGTNNAAGACREYYRAEFGKTALANDPVAQRWASTKGQWYLPSAEELDALMKNRTKINNICGGDNSDLAVNGFMSIGGEFEHAYWSSTEFNGTSAWYVLSRVGDGTDFPGNKRYGYNVKSTNKYIYIRPIRKVALQ